MHSRLSLLVVLCVVALLSLHPFAAASQALLAALPVARPALPVAGLQPSLAPSPAMAVLPAQRACRPCAATALPVMAEVQVCTPSGQRVTYPVAGVTASAIVKMATRQVSSRSSRCAATMREALGWGLGDAHEWLQLTACGFTRRPAGEMAQPGDIVVWPFTFGSRRSQHIGMAVGTDAGVRLLSNLTGGICVSDLAGGYCAFYKALPPPVAPPAALCHLPEPPRGPAPELRAGVITNPAALP